MDEGLEANIQHQLKILIEELLPELDENIKAMKADHAAKGQLKSGNTIRRTMEFVSDKVVKFHENILAHIRTLPLIHSGELETEINNLVSSYLSKLSGPAYEKLHEICKFAGNEKLYARVSNEVQEIDRRTQEKFRNGVNSYILELAEQTKNSPDSNRLVEGIEAVLLLAIAFLCGLWVNNPQDNYEPLIVLFGVVVSLLEIYRRKSAKAT